MSDAAVTRDGLTGVRPGRDALAWSANGPGAAARPAPNGADASRSGSADSPPREDHRGRDASDDTRTGSYYGRPIIKLPVWEEREIAGYLFLGGLAGGSSLLAAGAQATERTVLARRAKVCASAAIAMSLAALIKDLGRPDRFLHMLRVLKPTSPMSVGVWILSAYAPLTFAGMASDLLDRAPRAGRLASAGAGGLGAAVASYTAALIADTAVPAWHDGHRELPFVFAASSASAAAGFGLIAAPLSEGAPARRLALLGAGGELVAEQLLERRLGMVAQTLHEGSAGRRLRAAKLLGIAGGLGAATVARRSRGAATASGAALLAASALTRFGLFAAGIESARDPKYTVEPQRTTVPTP